MTQPTIPACVVQMRIAEFRSRSFRQIRPSPRRRKVFVIETPVISNEAVSLLHADGWPGNVRELENRTQAITLARGNQAKAARWLGLSRFTLREKLKQFGLHPDASDAVAEPAE